MSNPASSVLMGDLGEVVADGTAFAHATEWAISPKIGESAWGDSDSAGHTLRKGARKDCTGSFGGKFDTGDPFYSVVSEGDEPSLVLWASRTLYWWFSCVLVTGYNLTVNMDSKEVVGWTADFGESGKHYKPGEAGAPSKTYPGPAP